MTPHAPRARLGAHPRAHHHRLQRVAARADHRRARQRRGLPRGARAHPPVRLPQHRRRDPVVRQHAVQPAGRRRHPDRPVRPLEQRAAEDRLPQRPRLALRPAHADHLRHPLQLLAAGDDQREPLRADPQFPPHLVAADLPVRRLAGGLQQLRGGQEARAESRFSEGSLYLPHATSLRMGRLGYQSDAQASLRGELQQPGELRRLALRGAHRALPAVREDRHPGARTASTASSPPACCRSRTSSTPPSAPSAARGAASGRCTRCASAASSTSRCA